MEPSFFALFKRGKYFRNPNLDLDELDAPEAKEERRKRKEAERFAVAAIAFCSKHDETFLSHFLDTIVGSRMSLGSADSIRIEDKQWGDLVFVSHDRSLVAVIECKINATLEDIQNPETDSFWKVGYGADIQAAFPDSNINYIILGYPSDLNLKSNGRVKCFHKRWSHLDSGYPFGRPLALDLYESLAKLGVNRFRLRKTQDMKMENNAKFAGEAYGVLSGAFTTLDVAMDKIEPDIDYPGDGTWYFGLGLKKTDRANVQKTAHGRLQTLVSPKGSHIVWLGYQSAGQGPGTVFSVWFYCGTKTAERAITANLTSQLHTVKAKTVRHPVEGAEYQEIEVQAPVEAVSKLQLEGDQEWFVKVVRAAMDEQDSS